MVVENASIFFVKITNQKDDGFLLIHIYSFVWIKISNERPTNHKTCTHTHIHIRKTVTLKDKEKAFLLSLFILIFSCILSIEFLLLICVRVLMSHFVLSFVFSFLFISNLKWNKRVKSATNFEFNAYSLLQILIRIHLNAFTYFILFYFFWSSTAACILWVVCISPSTNFICMLFDFDFVQHKNNILQKLKMNWKFLSVFSAKRREMHRHTNKKYPKEKRRKRERKRRLIPYAFSFHLSI